jgi:serine/threonine-protein kinase HipA
MKRCLYCYAELADEKEDFHRGCSKKMFGTPIPPELPFTEDQMLQLAEKVVKSHTTVTGVQPKLSLHIEKISKKDEPQRFTIVGLWGGYILKPPTSRFRSLPELEDLTMHLAGLSSIEVVPHSLIRLQSGKLSYITRMTEQKYHGSYEQIAKAIIEYSVNPGLDLINFFEQVLFSFLTGNSDMHLKNYSLIDIPGTGYVLSPAYDMIASNLVVEGDEEELALTLNGKKKKIKKRDFLEAIKRFNIDAKAIENIFKKFENSVGKWNDIIGISFLPADMKKSFQDLIRGRYDRIYNA